MVRWLRWHCPPDTGFEIRDLAVCGRARYFSVTEAPHNTNFHTWMGKKQFFCFFQTAETGNRTPDSGVKGSGANHYPRAPAHIGVDKLKIYFFDNTFGLNCKIIYASNQNLKRFEGVSIVYSISLNIRMNLRKQIYCRTKIKTQYLLTLQVSRYCLLALQSRVVCCCRNTTSRECAW